MQSYENLKNLIDSSADDVAKCAGGNKAAGTRVRKAMQDIKHPCMIVIQVRHAQGSRLLHLDLNLN